MAQVTLPAGFELDAPVAQAATGLPSGFEVDQPKSPVQSSIVGPIIAAGRNIGGRILQAVDSPMLRTVAKRAATHALGSVVGGGIGHIVGGPVGTAVGAVIGNSSVPDTPDVTGAANYTKAAGSGNPNRLGPADIAYRKSAGQPMLIDEVGNYRAVPPAEVAAASTKAASRLAMLQSIIGKIGFAQSGLDLAQIAEPNRRDIGFLGASIEPARSDEEKAAHPALINDLVRRAYRALQGGGQ